MKLTRSMGAARSPVAKIINLHGAGRRDSWADESFNDCPLRAIYPCHLLSSMAERVLASALLPMACLLLQQQGGQTLSGLEKMYPKFEFHSLLAWLRYLRIQKATVLREVKWLFLV